MKGTAALVMALASLCSHAEGLKPDSIGLHLATYHFSAPARGADPWNNFNPGIYASWNLPHGSVMAGTFINSGNVRSNYVALREEVRVSTHFSIGGVVGGIGGYSRPISPLLGATVRLHLTQSSSAALTLTPKYGPGSSAAAHLTLDHAF